MNAAQCRAVFDFEDSLGIGDVVRVRWTKFGNAYVRIGTVCRKNAKSIRVKLSAAGTTCVGDPYPTGREIIVPLVSNINGWSVNNRVEPVDGYVEAAQ